MQYFLFFFISVVFSWLYHTTILYHAMFLNKIAITFCQDFESIAMGDTSLAATKPSGQQGSDGD